VKRAPEPTLPRVSGRDVDLKGRTALVTGASSGMGAAFARLLAARGADLVITARRADNLGALAGELATRHGVKVEVVPLDLAEPGAAGRLWAATEGAGRAVDVLVNNAGGGVYQLFLDTDRERVARQIQLNLVALTELTHLFAGAMLRRGRGHVLNVASIGAYTPTPALAVYSASKAFVRDFTEALAYELRRTPVRVCCLCPGGTATEFFQASGQAPPAALRATFMSAERCASIGLRALFGGRRNVVAGLMNKLSMFLLRFLPRRAIVRVTALVIGTPPRQGPARPAGQ
jgi:short-subunit dehydrogenase